MGKEKEKWFWVQLMHCSGDYHVNHEFIKSKDILDFSFSKEGIRIKVKRPDGTSHTYLGHEFIIEKKKKRNN